MRRLLAFAFALAAGLAPAHATQTDPVLTIDEARVVARAGGSLVQIDATYPAADMLQQPIPVQVLLRDTSGAGTAYVPDRQRSPRRRQRGARRRVGAHRRLLRGPPRLPRSRRPDQQLAVVAAVDDSRIVAGR